MLEIEDDKYGSIKLNKLDESHLFIEGKIGISKKLSFVQPLNFLISQVRLIYLVQKLARTHHILAIRIGDPYYLGLLGVLLSYLLKVPLVARIGFRFDELVKVTGRPVMARLFKYRWIEKNVEKFVFTRCNLIAGANEDNRQYAIENGANKNFTTVFRYGNLIHDSHWIEPKLRLFGDEVVKEFGFSKMKFAVTIARLEPMKYVEDAIRAFAELINRGHLIKFVVVGDGILKNKLQNLAKSLGIGNDVFFAGNRTQDWLAELLPKAELVISPHMGRALAEAALASLPIAAYDYDWQREIVINDFTGYIVPHQNWLELSVKAERILTDPILAKEMGKNARKLVLEMMNPERLEKHEKNEYDKLFVRIFNK